MKRYRDKDLIFSYTIGTLMIDITILLIFLALNTLNIYIRVVLIFLVSLDLLMLLRYWIKGGVIFENDTVKITNWYLSYTFPVQDVKEFRLAKPQALIDTGSNPCCAFISHRKKPLRVRAIQRSQRKKSKNKAIELTKMVKEMNEHLYHLQN